MCENNSKTPSLSIPGYLWKLPASQRCAVIGTCLKVSELRKIGLRYKTLFEPAIPESNYGLHSYTVALTEHKNPLSVHLNKLLNRRYQVFISELRSHKSEASLITLWKGLDRNDLRALGGYFWAILTSRHASERVRLLAYGDIHMISHIAGKTRRTQQRQQQSELKTLQQELAKKKCLLESKNRQLVDLRQTLESLKQINSRLRQQLAQAARDQKDTAGSPVQHSAVVTLKSIGSRPSATARRKKRASVTIQQVPVEPVRDCSGNCAQCKRAEADLCGKKVLYVGGFTRHRNKFQRLTEQINGTFYYHDGGMHSSEHLLDELVKKADCIFCPVDCISHSAIGRIKSLAKSHCKDCIFLKSASLSSFKQEITRYAS